MVNKQAGIMPEGNLVIFLCLPVCLSVFFSFFFFVVLVKFKLRQKVFKNNSRYNMHVL